MPETTGGSTEATLVLDSNLAELARLSAWIGRFCAGNAVPEETRHDLDLALEEVVINVIEHGGCNPPQQAIRISMKRENDDIHISVSDTGVAFDPLQAPPPDLSGGLTERPIGGLGIHLVRCLMPAISYERRDNCNWLYMIRRVGGTGTPARS